MIRTLKIWFWYLFNRDKVEAYIKNPKITIFNRFWYEEETDIWHLTVITSNGDVLNSLSIKKGKLEDTKQIFTQDMKIVYNNTFENYNIVNVIDGEKEPELYRKAADIVIEKEKEGKLESPLNNNWIFPD